VAPIKARNGFSGAGPNRPIELVFDELVGGQIIRHAQKRFRQDHQRQALDPTQSDFIGSVVRVGRIELVDSTVI